MAAEQLPVGGGVAGVLARLEAVRRSGHGYLARCPAHEDRQPSLSIREGEDGRLLLHCFAGCSTEAIVAAVGLRLADLFPAEGPVSVPGDGRARVHRPQPTPEPELELGLTVARYGEAKRLPLELLRELGLSDVRLGGGPAVRIPYLASDGAEAAVRHRLALAGERRFRWRRGSKPLLYGLWRLDRDRQATDGVVLVEGESDAQTLWLHRFNAVAVPGASNWRDERDAPELEQAQVVYLVVEPDRGGETLQRALSRSRLRERVRLVSLPEKDASGLYLADPDRFAERFAEALERALPLAEHERRLAAARGRAAWRQCAELAGEGRILDRFAAEFRGLGHVGEERAAKLLYLAVMSRLLERPVSVAVKGSSSAGKSSRPRRPYRNTDSIEVTTHLRLR